MMALNAETGNAAMNVKLGSGDGSERRNRECDSDGSERQTKRNIDECQSETKALHAQLNW